MAPELMPPLTDVSSIYGIGMFIVGALLAGVAVLEKPNDLACRIGSARRAGSNLGRSMFGNWPVILTTESLEFGGGDSLAPVIPWYILSLSLSRVIENWSHAHHETPYNALLTPANTT